MGRINAAITGIGAYLPEYRLKNEELSAMVDTTDEWIMKRIGIKERRILKGHGNATSYMGVEAVKQLFRKTGAKADQIGLLLCATITPDMPFPATANIISHKAGAKHAWGFDINAACSGFIYTLATAARFVESGKYKKVVVVAADKMSAITNYNDRTTCPLFGDAAVAVLLEPSTGGLGVIDYIHHVDGIGSNYLNMKAGGSLKPATIETVQNNEHYIFQEGQTVFKHAVSGMAGVTEEIMGKYNLTADNIDWLVPHQANMRIIDATARRVGIARDKVMVNIEKYGNTTAATIPLCLYDYEKQLRKGDNIILTAFGAGFTWGSVFVKWAYDSI